MDSQAQNESHKANTSQKSWPVMVLEDSIWKESKTLQIIKIKISKLEISLKFLVYFTKKALKRHQNWISNIPNEKALEYLSLWFFSVTPEKSSFCSLFHLILILELIPRNSTLSPALLSFAWFDPWTTYCSFSRPSRLNRSFFSLINKKNLHRRQNRCRLFGLFPKQPGRLVWKLLRHFLPIWQTLPEKKACIFQPKPFLLPLALVSPLFLQKTPSNQSSNQDYSGKSAVFIEKSTLECQSCSQRALWSSQGFRTSEFQPATFQCSRNSLFCQCRRRSKLRLTPCSRNGRSI